MPLIEYRMNLLEMGTFTCIAIGDGGIIMGGCAIYGYAIGVVIPRHCFKFEMGDKAYTGDGSPVFVIKVRSEGRDNFYQVTKNGLVIELPESSLFKLSELVSGVDLSDIEDSIDKIVNLPTKPVVPGKKKVSDPAPLDPTLLHMMKAKFLRQIQELANKPSVPTPPAGKKTVPTSTNVFDIDAFQKNVLDKLDKVECVTPVADPPTGKKIVPNPVEEVQFPDTAALNDKLDILSCVPQMADPPSGKKVVPEDVVSPIEPDVESIEKKLEKLEEVPPVTAQGGKIFVYDDFENLQCEEVLEVTENLLDKLKVLNDCVESLPPPEGEIIFPEQDVHITVMRGGIIMGGCAYVVPPAGHCFTC